MGAYGAAFVGGVLIGLAAVLMLFFNGRILGVSGILGGLVTKASARQLWRYLFLAGVLAAGVLLRRVEPEALGSAIVRSPLALVAAGLLVGYGTRLSGGCTSGHGVCGVSRLSSRSLVATVVFIGFGAATVFVVNHLLGGRV